MPVEDGVVGVRRAGVSGRCVGAGLRRCCPALRECRAGGFRSSCSVKVACGDEGRSERFWVQKQVSRILLLGGSGRWSLGGRACHPLTCDARKNTQKTPDTPAHQARQTKPAQMTDYTQARQTKLTREVSTPLTLTLACCSSFFFSEQLPGYATYGGLGNVIDHEILHGFDIEGYTWDEYGVFADS